VGKTQLLRTLAWLEPLETGQLLLDGHPPAEIGIPRWRSQVTYVAQSCPRLPGTPSDLYQRLCGLAIHVDQPRIDPIPIAAEWGLAETIWTQPWKALSGGESQRARLAITLALSPQILLLDEPTAALDPDATLAVEASLQNQSCIWVTHDKGQAQRIADQTLELTT